MWDQDNSFSSDPVRRDDEQDSSPVYNYRHLIPTSVDSIGQLTQQTDSFNETTAGMVDDRPGALAKQGCYFARNEYGASNNQVLFTSLGLEDTIPAQRISHLGVVVGDQIGDCLGVSMAFAHKGWIPVLNVSNKNWEKGDRIYSIIYPFSEFQRFRHEYCPEYLKDPRTFVPILVVSGKNVSQINAIKYVFERIQVTSAAGKTEPAKGYNLKKDNIEKIPVSDIHFSVPSKVVNDCKGNVCETAFLHAKYLATIVAVIRSIEKDGRRIESGINLDNNEMATYKGSNSLFQDLLKHPMVIQAGLNEHMAAVKLVYSTFNLIGRVQDVTAPTQTRTVQLD